MSTQSRCIPAILSWLGQNVSSLKFSFHLPAEQEMREEGAALGQIPSSLHKPLLQMPFRACPQQQGKYLQFSPFSFLSLDFRNSWSEHGNPCERPMAPLVQK